MSVRMPADPNDPFEQVSIHWKCNAKVGHVQEIVAATREAHRGEFVICRFVEKDGEPGKYGWPLRWPTDRLKELAFEIREPTLMGLGWNEEGRIAFFDEETATEIAEQGKTKISFDRAVHADALQWRVIFFSHFDGSSIEMYRGDDYNEATAAFAAAELLKSRTDSKNYLKVVFEGVVSIDVVNGWYKTFHSLDCRCPNCLIGGMPTLPSAS